MNYDAFSHGQIKSKIWLCEKLEPHLPVKPTVTILGCWYNVLSFMLLTRNPDGYKSFVGIDVDADAIDVSNKICNAWTTNEIVVNNFVANANSYIVDTDVVINCSPEHMEGTAWFDNIPSGTLVCIQTSNVIDPEYPWLIKTPSPTLEAFTNRFRLSTVLSIDSLRIEYNHFGYDRYMIIGIK